MRRASILALVAFGAIVLTGVAWSSQSTQTPAAMHHHAMTSTGVPQAACPARRQRTHRDGQVCDEPRPREERRLHGHRHAPDPGHGLALHEPGVHEVRRHEAADPRLRQARRPMAARRLRVGLPVEAGQAAASRGDLRLVRGRVSLQGRTFVPAASQDDCAPTSPETGAPFGFWHPDFVTLHLWLWYPNPDGIYAGMNPLISPFNKG